MEHVTAAAWLTEAANAAAQQDQQGAGNLLRIVLVVAIVGSVLLGWFLLRGYRRDGGDGDGGSGTGGGSSAGGGSSTGGDGD
ncbi:hypothetical protein ACWD4J_25070 [Streptomyces sp. NPDC002577]